MLLAKHKIPQNSWNPSFLGSSLLAWWSADYFDSLTQSGGAVSAWRDLVGGYEVEQATGNAQPIYSSDSYNGRPGLTYDGINDVLLLTTDYPSTFPINDEPAWMWGLVHQQRLSSVAGTNTIFQFGSNTPIFTRRLVRAVNGGQNRIALEIGNGTSTPAARNSTTDFLGRYAVIGKSTSTTAEAAINGIGMTPVAAVGATSTGRISIGGAVNGGNFWLGVINSVLLTSPLSPADEYLLTSYLQKRTL